jgi:hypothetical protein
MKKNEIVEDLEIENRDEFLSLIGDIESKRYTQASDTFQSLLNQKLRDSLEAKKIAIASSLFSGPNDDEEFEDDDDYEEEEEEDEDEDYEDDEEEYEEEENQ